MSKNLIENDNYTVTRFYISNGKLGYQITQRTHNDLSFDYVLLTKQELLHILKRIEEDINE